MAGEFFFDTETALIEPGLLAPPLTCLTYTRDGEGNIVDRHAAYEELRSALVSGFRLVGCNVAFDLAVVCNEYPDLTESVFDAYCAGLVHDIAIREQLIDLHVGRLGDPFRVDGKWHAQSYSLADLALKRIGIALKKDEHRLGFGELRDIPIAQWPEGAVKYAIDDALLTRKIFLAQEPLSLKDEDNQVRAAWFLHLQSAWGLRTKKSMVENLERSTQARLDELFPTMQSHGFVRINKIGGKNPRIEVTRDMKKVAAAVQSAYLALGVEAPSTESGAVSTSSEACDDSGDPALLEYGEYTKLSALMNKDVKALLQGVDTPIHTRYSFLKTGRAGSSSPNIQNWRRLPGVRECFVPRDGFVYLQADVAGLELATLAQVCLGMFGRSELAKALVDGKDVHTLFASTLARVSYEHFRTVQKTGRSHADYPTFERYRGLAKIGNFGIPGGLGVDALVLNAKRQGVIMTRDEGQSLRDGYMRQWPEMVDYFAYFANRNKRRPLLHYGTQRSYMAKSYTESCNALFQGLGADAMKCVGFLLAKACYVTPSSPIFGGRPVVFAHDENIVEFPRGPGMHAAAMELAAITEAGCLERIPNIPVKAPPVIMAYWSKKAEAVYDSDGNLTVWGDK